MAAGVKSPVCKVTGAGGGERCLSSSDGWAAASGLGHNFQVQGSSPVSGSQLSKGSASPSPSASPTACAFSVSLSNE